MANVEEDRVGARSSYSSQTERGKNWDPSNYRKEYGYTQYWSSGADWAYLDGRWRETSDPTMGEVSIIEGEEQKLCFVEFAEYTYEWILTYKPKYVEFLTGGGDRDHIDMEKFPEWVMYKDVGITEGRETGDAEWENDA